MVEHGERPPLAIDHIVTRPLVGGAVVDVLGQRGGPRARRLQHEREHRHRLAEARLVGEHASARRRDLGARAPLARAHPPQARTLVLVELWE